MKFRYRPETDTLAVLLTGGYASATNCARGADGVVAVFHNEKNEPVMLEIGGAQAFVKGAWDDLLLEDRLPSRYETPPNPVAISRFAFSPEVDILSVLLSPEPYDYASENHGVIAHYTSSGQPTKLQIQDGRDFVRGAIAATMNKSHTAVVNGKTRKPRKPPTAALQNRAQEAAD